LAVDEMMIEKNHSTRPLTYHAKSLENECIVSLYNLEVDVIDNEIILPRSLTTTIYDVDTSHPSLLEGHRIQNNLEGEYWNSPGNNNYFRRENAQQYIKRKDKQDTLQSDKSVVQIAGIVPVREIMQAAGLEKLLFADVKSNHDKSYEVHSDFDDSVILHEEYEHSCEKKLCKLCSSTSSS
jgi:hypothetical protein